MAPHTSDQMTGLTSPLYLSMLPIVSYAYLHSYMPAKSPMSTYSVLCLLAFLAYTF